VKLPLWRLAAGLALPTALVAVLLLLAPAYLSNYRLQQFLQSSVASSGTAEAVNEQGLRMLLVGRAHELGLPVDPGEVTVTHPGGKTRFEIKYKVRRDFGLYQVDLHFDPSATK
jgi:hypothetical protein